MSLMSDAFSFSSGNELSNLPYPDDINFGPVPEKTSSQTSSLSPSSPSIRAGQICPLSFTAATATETYSEKANVQLHQFKGALNLLFGLGRHYVYTGLAIEPLRSGHHHASCRYPGSCPSEECSSAHHNFRFGGCIGTQRTNQK